MKKNNLGVFILILFSVFFTLFCSFRNLKVKADAQSRATATSFTVSDATVGATGVTYTFQFTVNQQISSGGTMNFDLNRISAKSTWEGGDQTSNMASATGTVTSFQYNSGSGWQDIDYGGSSYFHKEISSSNNLLIWGFGYASDIDIHGVQTTIPADSSVKLVISDVTNPAKAGAYALSVETGIGPSSNTFWLLPLGRGDGTFDELSRALYVDIGTACLRVKVKDPTGATAIPKAELYLHNSNWTVTSWGGKTYADGARSYYPDDFWYTGGPSQATCPVDSITIEASPPSGVTDYARASDSTATLPANRDTYYDTPITLSLIQLQGTLVNPSGVGQYAKVSNTNVSFRPSDFSPTGFKTTNSDTNGVFKMGGLTEGTYVVEFMMPWQSGYEGITSPDAIQIEVNASGQLKTVSGSSACTSFAASCNLGSINYKAATKTITGKVLDQDGNPVTDGRVRAFKEMGMGWAEDTLDSEGNYSLTIGGGTWGVTPEANWQYGNPPEWTFCGMPRFFTFATDESIETKTAVNTNNQTNFTVKKSNVTVTGRLVYPDGTAFTSGGGVEVRAKEGCGSFAPLNPATGQFTTTVAPGTYNIFVQLWSPNYSAPAVQSITVSSGTYDAGTFTLVEKKDTISGRIWTDLNGSGSYDSGEGVNNQRVNAFKMSKKFDEFSGPGGGGPGGGPGGAMGGGDVVDSTSGNEGVYTLKVTPGTWMVNVMADPGMMGGYSETQTNYIYSGSPLQVNVETSTNGNTFANNNFRVVAADATIKGKLVNEQGNGISGIWGFSFADSGSGPMMGSGMGAPIQNGIFTLKVPAGTYNIGVEFPPETSGYTPAGNTAVTVAAGATQSVNVTVRPNNSRIRVNFKDPSGNAVTTLSRAEVFADNGSGGHQFKMLYGSDLSSGSTTLSISEGTWSVGYFIDATENNYMSEPMAKDNRVVVTAANDANNPAVINVTLRSADSTVSGTVTGPTGTALAGAWISTDNRKASGFDISGPMFMQGKATASDGTYSISVPAGTYMIQAFLPPSMGYINPQGVEVTVSPTSPGTVNLQFTQSDATITGSVYLSGVKKGSFVTAYSENGGYSETNASGGDYTLNVTKNDTWYVRAMYESGTDFYQSPVYKVVMAGSTSKSQDATLTKATFTLPDAVSTTFDYRNAKKITLANGFSLSIPAGAISPGSNATGNNITISISPTGQLSTQNKAIPVGVGYEITASDDSGSLITENFNSNVTITIPYTEAYLREALGLTDESMLDNGYWDTSTSAWKGISGATIDTESNTISFTVNHFTTFSILSTSNQTSTTSSSSSVSSGSSSGTTSSGSVSKPMAPKDIGVVVEGATNKVFLMLPAKAIGWDADFDIEKIEQGFAKPNPPLWIAGGPYKTVMKAWWNNAKFSEFKKSVTLIIRYDPTSLGKIPENSLRLNYYDESGKRWRPMSSLLIKDRHEVAAVIDELQNKYALIGGYGQGGSAQVSDRTVTVVSDSQKVGLTEKVLPPQELKANPSLQEESKTSDLPANEEEKVKPKNWWQNLIDKAKRIFGK